MVSWQEDLKHLEKRGRYVSDSQRQRWLCYRTCGQKREPQDQQHRYRAGNESDFRVEALKLSHFTFLIDVSQRLGSWCQVEVVMRTTVKEYQLVKSHIKWENSSIGKMQNS